MSFIWSLNELDLVELDRLAQRLALVLTPGDVIVLVGAARRRQDDLRPSPA